MSAFPKITDDSFDPDEDFIFSDFLPLAKLGKDVRDAGSLIERDEARDLVSTYYGLQKFRLSLRNQERQLVKAEKPHRVVTHFAGELSTLEKNMVSVLDKYSLSTEVGQWSRSILGIGPVIAAGLMAHIDIKKAPTVGHIWRFAGLDPTVTWGKGEKRPWNADLKVLCWKIGDSFVKVSGRPDAFYGKIYRERKEYELARDERGGNSETAARTLETKNFRDLAVKRIYESGHLPPGRLDLRARRYAAKLFLAHWHEVAYIAEFGKEPPLPYPIAHLGHAHKIEVPVADGAA
jgi:hypothetical protein